uniref:Esterase n=1 Tax=Bionectria ochroleuca TaxID=29856 RepID=A0A8H7K9A1_BIOOC
MQIRCIQASTVRPAESWLITSAQGLEYLIQIGYPRDWLNPQSKPKESSVPIMYLTDGNSVFSSSLERLHQHLVLSEFGTSAGIVVAIGYLLQPDSNFLWSARRNWDLTPPSPGCLPSEGGADEFAKFIQSRVKPLVHQRIRELREVNPGAQCLYGHSHGGLFTLHTMFTRPWMFDTYIAASPSISWNNVFILEEEASFRSGRVECTSPPSLMLYVGGAEQNPRRKRDETDDEYEKRREQYQKRKDVDSVLEMNTRLRESGRMKYLLSKVYDGEDHGTVIACSISQGLATFFDGWPYID